MSASRWLSQSLARRVFLILVRLAACCLKVRNWWLRAVWFTPRPELPQLTPRQAALQARREKERLEWEARIKARRQEPKPTREELLIERWSWLLHTEDLPTLEAVEQAVNTGRPFVLKQLYPGRVGIQGAPVRRWHGRFPEETEVYEWLAQSRAKRGQVYALFIGRRILAKYLVL